MSPRGMRRDAQVAKADASDVKALKAALTGFGSDIEYVEASPGRSLKA
jgi:hypothetical protein